MSRVFPRSSVGTSRSSNRHCGAVHSPASSRPWRAIALSIRVPSSQCASIDSGFITIGWTRSSSRNSFLAACSSSGAACERMATSQSLVARAVPRALDPYSTTASMPGIEATASAAVRRRRACVVVFIPMYPAGRANNRSVHSRIADTRGRYRKRIPALCRRVAWAGLRVCRYDDDILNGRHLASGIVPGDSVLMRCRRVRANISENMRTTSSKRIERGIPPRKAKALTCPFRLAPPRPDDPVTSCGASSCSPVYICERRSGQPEGQPSRDSPVYLCQRCLKTSHSASSSEWKT